MTTQKLVKSTHPMLKKEILPVSAFDENLRTLLQDLEDTLYEEEAVAISAPQIGMNQRVALIDMEYEGLLQLINSVILNQSHETVTELEGSISLPNVFGEVERSNMIVVQSYDVNGYQVELTAYDDVARMIQHMVDHLNGILFTDKSIRILNETEVEAYFDNE
ncbi:peptide deformylase [Staphylococcus saccharolyticus]|uniref:Peptide deformylase-like n=1 Tax=Staphylococcus saccharolyticus TaxID=33028 RepID=A0A380H7E8_9STAP|nr:peptide deformylase [Staphylococcus saccharolyticus]MBL7565447.1 peptide deformylase [Staphylococcus saccharolyticus]MBL7571496.1 peptide deformylase [Staphylococcus saccharolyticus]QQB98014.1 peptide deformylase [Staphylococcus saccharolyticus]QRJ66131.1 peptide deformylase [Staphylococcus saccharolyticus]RTX99620.1 peptide deformylase [Staphylococcus saccharolyticus]